MLFSKRRMRLAPPRPRRLAISAPPTAAVAPQVNPIQKSLWRTLPSQCSSGLEQLAPPAGCQPESVQLTLKLPARRDVTARIHIGTSGWHYKHWVGTFYPPKMPASKMFAFYQQYFDTVELNNSFYRLPTPEAFMAWRDAAADKFIFAVKGSRFLTHNKKLKEPEQALQNLLPRAELLGE